MKSHGICYENTYAVGNDEIISTILEVESPPAMCIIDLSSKCIILLHYNTCRSACNFHWISCVSSTMTNDCFVACFKHTDTSWNKVANDTWTAEYINIVDKCELDHQDINTTIKIRQ